MESQENLEIPQLTRFHEKFGTAGYFDLTNYTMRVAILLYPDIKLELFDLRKGTIKLVILGKARESNKLPLKGVPSANPISISQAPANSTVWILF